MAQNMTKGLIALDFIEDRIVDVAARNQNDSCRGFDYLDPPRPMIPEFLVLHKEQSPPDSTVAPPNGYFAGTCCPALTDLEVNSVTGKMYRFVKRGTRIAGWANGVINTPYGDALKYIQWKMGHGGWNPNWANIKGEACEITGYFPSHPVTQDTPVLDPAKKTIARWMASRAHDFGIRWQDFPLVVAEGNRSYVTWHQEWTIGTGKTCPGPVVMNMTPELIEMARAIMKEAQGGTVPTPPSEYPAPKGIPNMSAGDPVKDTHDVWWFPVNVQVEATKKAVPRTYASTKAPPAADTIAVKAKATVIAYVKPDVAWLVLDDHTRVLASSFTPSIAMKVR